MGDINDQPTALGGSWFDSIRNAGGYLKAFTGLNGVMAAHGKEVGATGKQYELAAMARGNTFNGGIFGRLNVQQFDAGIFNGVAEYAVILEV